MNEPEGNRFSTYDDYLPCNSPKSEPEGVLTRKVTLWADACKKNKRLLTEDEISEVMEKDHLKLGEATLFECVASCYCAIAAAQDEKTQQADEAKLKDIMGQVFEELRGSCGWRRDNDTDVFSVDWDDVVEVFSKWGIK